MGLDYYFFVVKFYVRRIFLEKLCYISVWERHILIKPDATSIWKIKLCIFAYIESRCYLGLIVPLENFSLIKRRQNYRWRAASVDQCSALMAIEKWGFFRVPPTVSCHYLFLLLKSVAGIRTPNLPLAGPMLLPTAPSPRFIDSRTENLNNRSISGRGGVMIYFYGIYETSRWSKLRKT